ncbi:MAG: hypothetical protein ACT4OE_07020 [Sphingosinicella sp.]
MVDIAPPPVVTTAPPPPAAIEPTPLPATETAPRRNPTTQATRAPARSAFRTARATAPAPRPVATRPAEAPAVPAPEPSAPPPAEAAAPELAPPPAVEPAATTPAEEESGAGGLIFLAIGLGLVALLGWFLFRRMRQQQAAMESWDHEHPVPMMELPMAKPLAESPRPQTAAAASAVSADEPVTGEAVASVEKLEVGRPSAADVAALAAATAPVDGRPWLEFLMRPIRAGTTSNDAVVEFELTVGNTGSAPARDVRISTFMFPAGSAQEKEMENLLIDPPADAQVLQNSISPGDGARVEASLSLPKSAISEAVLPVVVADARYTLPDGSEGRTSAAFEVGLPGGEALAPFPVDRSSGLLETVEARLHGELQRS